MKKLFIPDIGTEITLGKDWEFLILLEHRNGGLISHLGMNYKELSESREVLCKELFRFKQRVCKSNGCEPKNAHYVDEIFNSLTLNEVEEIEYSKIKNDLKNSAVFKVKLKKDSVLKIDRIYIRKGKHDFSSVSFILKEEGGKKVTKVRFWVWLEDVNNLYYKET